MAFQALLPYALAAYGGYKGYKASKDAGGSGLQRLLATGTGAFLGYQGGKMFAGPEFGTTVPSFTQLPPLQSIGRQFPALGITQVVPQQTVQQAALSNSFFVPMSQQQNAAISSSLLKNPNTDSAPQGGMMDLFNKLLRRQRVNKAGDPIGEMEFDPGKVAAAIGIGSALGGVFEPKPQDVFQPTYNLAVAELQKQRGGFKYIDPVSGEEKTFEQVYIPEADPKNQGDFRMGPYAIEKTRLKEGGLAEVKKFNQGGINYLPSKRTHDEDDANNYERAMGYVEDGSGTGDKDEDTMLAQLADGEFVTRADGVLGAGIIAGANPSSMKDMREKGAQYFYEQQKRYKRVFDLLEGSRNAKAQAN
jgi:hypothetical protein